MPLGRGKVWSELGAGLDTEPTRKRVILASYFSALSQAQRPGGVGVLGRDEEAAD